MDFNAVTPLVRISARFGPEILMPWILSEIWKRDFNAVAHLQSRDFTFYTCILYNQNLSCWSCIFSYIKLHFNARMNVKKENIAKINLVLHSLYTSDHLSVLH